MVYYDCVKIMSFLFQIVVLAIYECECTERSVIVIAVFLGYYIFDYFTQDALMVNTGSTERERSASLP